MKQKRFTQEFKDEAVRLVLTSGRRQAEVARDLGLGVSTLDRWLCQARGRAVPVDGGETPEAGLKRLRRDIAECCAAHLTKLAIMLAECVKYFPFYSCPGRAFTAEGMLALGYSWQDVELALGLPLGYTDVGDFPASEKLRILSREIEPLDLEAVERMVVGDHSYEWRANSVSICQ